MPKCFVTKGRLYDELKDNIEFKKFLKETTITKNFIKFDLESDDNDFSGMKPWHSYVDTDKRKKCAIVKRHGGLDGDGRLALFYDSKTYRIEKLVYWLASQESPTGKDLESLGT